MTIEDSKGRRAEPRSVVDQYHSVEFSAGDLEYSYHFKIWNLSLKGMCVLVKENSAILAHLKVGDVFNLKYYTEKPSYGQEEQFKTEIKHISKDEEGRFKGHYLVGLSILEKESSLS